MPAVGAAARNGRLCGASARRRSWERPSVDTVEALVVTVREPEGLLTALAARKRWPTVKCRTVSGRGFVVGVLRRVLLAGRVVGVSRVARAVLSLVAVVILVVA